MPATIVFYTNPSDVQDYEKFVFSPNTTLTYFTRNVYSDPQCSKIIGTKFYETYVHNFSGNSAIYFNAFIKFFENSGFPYGDDNILVISGTSVNKTRPDNLLLDGTYIYQVNSALSNGEYSGQVGNCRHIVNREASLNNVTTVYFPQPILTYTNAFNSLPQPSTAPLPA